jgi:23S rRNA (cytosine1962-C5)-methyltransferase
MTLQRAEEWFAPDKRRRLLLRRGRERTISNHHPWIFSGAIHSEEGPPDAAVADLVDGSGAVLASGWYSEHSQIRLRALTFGEPLTPDLLRQRIAASIARRASFLNEGTNALRLINAEGDSLSGMVVDRYGAHLVAEITSAGLDRVREIVIDVLRRTTGAESLLFRNASPARKIERLPLEDESVGDPPDETVILENGLQFTVSPRQGQKTGFFLDQRENRRKARELAGGRRVLNLFAYSGGFGVYAAAGGASSIEEVDVSADAIALARRNHELNRSPAEVQFVVADAFKHVRHLAAGEQRYDLVVCDPPAFAKSRGEVDRAARGYKDVNLYAFRLVAPGGMLMTFSCSGHVDADLFQKIVFAAALDAHREVSIVERLGAGPDHPVSIYCPEGEYLKGLLLRVD